MPGTVLIVDDSDSIRGRVQKALEGAGLFDHYVEAKDGIEGFKLLVDRSVDLVLCDVVMPGMDGFKFLSMKKTRAELADVPVIMLTGEEDVEEKVRALEAGASDYLTKPFHDTELVARVRVHMSLKLLRDELKRKNQRLEEISRVDSLTDVFNRRYFMERLEVEYARAVRYKVPMALVMLDLDHFKRINDTHGHQTGDEVLKTLGHALGECLRSHDLVGRYGGEEFALLLPQTDKAGAESVAERCRLAVEELTVASRGVSVDVTVSLGIAIVPHPDVHGIPDLIRLADKALYAAKNSGRNRCVTA